MARHFIFLVLYLFAAGALGAIAVGVLFVMHCTVNLINDIIREKKGIQFIHAYYIGASVSTLANVYYLDRINTYGVRITDIYFYIVLDHVVVASLIWVVGNTFMFIGYDLFKKRSLQSIRLDISNKTIVSRLFQFILVLSLLTFSGNAINLSFITGGLQKVLSLLNLMGILFFARLWVVERSRTYRNYAVVLCILQTLIALYTSFLRLDLLTPLASFAGGYFIGKGSIKYLLSIRIVPIILIMVLFSSFFNTLGGNRAHFITAFTQGGNDEVSSYTDLSASESERGGVFERSSNIAQLTNVVSLVERNGTYNGRASLPLIAALVPRFLWPDKPQIQLGAWFALEIGAGSISNSGRVNNSVNMSIPGELYLDFGWIGVVLGSILLGGALALFWNAAHFNDSPYNLFGALWGGYLLLYGLFGLGADLQILISLISTYIVFLILKNIFAQYASVLSRPAVAR